MEINEKKQKVYDQIDYSSEATLYASKVKLENVLSSNVKLDDETEKYYKEALEEIDSNLKHKIIVTDNHIFHIGNIDNNIITEGEVISKSGIMIGCYYSTTRAKEPEAAYFKVFNNESHKMADKVARITYLNSDYEYHKDETGKQPWIMNNSDIDNLISVLKFKVNGETVWYWLCYELYRVTNENKLYFPNLPIPNFEKLREIANRGMGSKGGRKVRKK